MKIYNTSKGILIEAEDVFYKLDEKWDTFINDDHLYDKCQSLIRSNDPIKDGTTIIKEHLLIPMQSQELWASGVTYFNSKLARQEESEKAGGGTFYEKVYHADRPELFFKATSHRTVASGGHVRIRKDSTWNVPEPELTLIITSSGNIVGYTIGNDMSSRSIEGDNPLYLPQAKTYDGCASVGPCILVTKTALDPSTNIKLTVQREQAAIFQDNISISQMKRNPKDLVSYLYRECSFPYGCLLMTGTGIVPSTEFTLHSGDEICIEIQGIGRLINIVA